MRKLPYLVLGAINKKKATLISSTLKVRESKVLKYFQIRLLGQDLAIFGSKI